MIGVDFVGIKGPSLNTGKIAAKPYPLVYSEDIPAHNMTSADARYPFSNETML